MKKKSRNRTRDLDTRLRKAFGHLDPDTVDLFASYYGSVVNDMIEIIEAGEETCSAKNIYCDTQYDRIFFRPDLQPLLKSKDVFLVTMGLLDGEWHVIHCSTLYNSVTVHFDEMAENA